MSRAQTLNKPCDNSMTTVYKWLPHQTNKDVTVSRYDINLSCCYNMIIYCYNVKRDVILVNLFSWRGSNNFPYNSADAKKDIMGLVIRL